MIYHNLKQEVNCGHKAIKAKNNQQINEETRRGELADSLFISNYTHKVLLKVNTQNYVPFAVTLLFPGYITVSIPMRLRV